MKTDSLPSRARLLPPLMLAATAAFVFFFRLGERGFENKDTVWYVEIAWEMLRSGDWIVPRFNAVIFTEKPVLFIWLVAASARIAGGITPFISRFPSALAAFGCVFVTLALGKRLLGRRAALLAAFVLSTNYAFAWEARTCMVDMVFTFFVTLALYLLYRGFSDGGHRGHWFIPAYFAAGLAALTKGPLGVVLPALVSLVYLAWQRRLKFLREMRIPWGILIVAGIQAAWYAPYLVRIGPDGRRFFYEMYVYKENLLRFTSGFDKAEPFWFYAPAILSHFLPWSILLVLYPFIPRPAEDTGAPRDRAFPAAWFLGLFAFLTLSSGKHSRYALPLYPAAALLAGDAWDRLIASGAGRMSRAVSATAAAFAAGGAVGIPIYAWFAAPGFFIPSILLSALLVASAAGVFCAQPDEKASAAFIAVVVAFACFWAVFIASLPAHEAQRAEHARLARQISPAVGTGRLATYGLFSRRLALGFFTGRTVNYIDREEHLSDYLRSGERVFCLMETAEYEKLREKLPPHAKATGGYRYRKFDLVLISTDGVRP
ncbi:MAG: glycosyltransferase family 39 protein [Chlamydiota bacterium]